MDQFGKNYPGRVDFLKGMFTDRLSLRSWRQR